MSLLVMQPIAIKIDRHIEIIFNVLNIFKIRIEHAFWLGLNYLKLKGDPIYAGENSGDLPLPMYRCSASTFPINGSYTI